jgi:hypothetical protein
MAAAFTVGGPARNGNRQDSMTADAWGIEPGFKDALGVWRETDQATRRAIREVMGDGSGAPAPPPGPRVRVLRQGESIGLSCPSELTLEDGTTLSASKVTPPDLPLGYHRLTRLDDAAGRHLIVAPSRCHLPANLRAWGWAVQLYGLRSASSWGMGDLADLRRLAQRSADELGAGMLLVNPPSGSRRDRTRPKGRSSVTRRASCWRFWRSRASGRGSSSSGRTSVPSSRRPGASSSATASSPAA